MAAKGQPKTGGRAKGTPNKATADIKAIAQDYGHEAVGELAKIMRDVSAPHASRVAAIKELLDRGYGKSIQTTDLKSSDGSMTPKPILTQDELRTIAAEMVDKV